MFTSVRTPRVYEHIVAQIEHAIFAGGYRCGDRLPPERELVRQFHASRVAVREALRTLEHRGLVEVRHGASGGHFVRQVDGELLRRDFTTLLRLGRVALAQLTEARLLIEPEVARLAAIRCTEGDVGTLRTAVEERAAVVMAGRPPRPLDLVFHRAVAAAARNPVHAMLTDALMDLEVEVVAPSTALAKEDDAAVAESHEEILDAIASRQPERAREAMARHIVDVQRRLRRIERENVRGGGNRA